MSYIYIKYYQDIDQELLKLWINHYSKLNIDFKIYCENDYSNNEIIKKYVINTISASSILITEYDYLFNYSINPDEKEDNMILSYNIDKNFTNQSLLIGRVFYNPVTSKPKYTTFEIPDFILYKHSDHTSYTKSSIKINNGQNISNNIVCFSLKVSNMAFENEYYENNILFGGDISQNIYTKYADNIIANKNQNKKYAVIWHPKCACTTICSIILNIYNIDIKDNHCLSIIYKKYRYNNFLQNFDSISFVRNPYNRFISCYLNKHIDKIDNYYLSLDTYKNYISKYSNKDTLINLIEYYTTNNPFIDEHTILLSNLYYNVYNLKPKIIHIEDGCEDHLYNFLEKYHIVNSKYKLIHNYTKTNIETDITSKILFKYFDYNDWMNYKKNNIYYPNYSNILDDDITDKIYNIYKKDFIKYNYSQPDNKDKYKEEYLRDFDNKYKDFDWKIYTEIHDDLKHLDIFDAKYHYSNYGIIEKRKYTYEHLPNDFNWKIYRELNDDLKNLNENELKKHYEYDGHRENRLYK